MYTVPKHILTLCLYLSRAHWLFSTKAALRSDWRSAAETRSRLSGATSSSLDTALSQPYPTPCNRIYRVVVELRFPFQVAPAERVGGRDTGTIQSHRLCALNWFQAFWISRRRGEDIWLGILSWKTHWGCRTLLANGYVSGRKPFLKGST